MWKEGNNPGQDNGLEEVDSCRCKADYNWMNSTTRRSNRLGKRHCRDIRDHPVVGIPVRGIPDGVVAAERCMLKRKILCEIVEVGTNFGDWSFLFLNGY